MFSPKSVSALPVLASRRRPRPARAALLGLVSAVLLGLGLVAVGPLGTGTAQAASCTCKKPGSGRLIDQADVVVSGTIAAEDDTTTPHRFTVKLDRVYRGEFDTNVLSVSQNPNCPLTGVAIGERWVVLGRTQKATSGTGSASATPSSQTTTAAPQSGATAAAPTATATPSPTAASGTPTSTSSATTAPNGSTVVAIGCNLTGKATATRISAVQRNFGSGSAPTRPTPPEPVLTKVETAAPDQFRRMAAPGAAMLVIGLLGLIAVRRLGRAKR